MFSSDDETETVSHADATRWSHSVTLLGSLYPAYLPLISIDTLYHLCAMSARKKTGKTGSDRLSGLHMSILGAL